MTEEMMSNMKREIDVKFRRDCALRGVRDSMVKGVKRRQEVKEMNRRITWSAAIHYIALLIFTDLDCLQFS